MAELTQLRTALRDAIGRSEQAAVVRESPGQPGYLAMTTAYDLDFRMLVAGRYCFQL